MIEAEYAQKLTSESFVKSGEVPKLELDGLTAGAIADLCNVSREWRSRNVRIHGGDFADESGEVLPGVSGSAQGKHCEAEKSIDNIGGGDVQEEGVNQYYLPLQPFSLPVGSRPPHIEPGRVDIRLHALYNKLGRI